MITQCDKCKKKQDVPDVYRGRQIKCQYCKEPITAHEYVPLPQIPKPDPVQVTLEVIKNRNPIRSAWNRMPTPFKTAFLSTFGVMSALLITFFVYGHALGLRGTKNNLMTIEKAQSILKENRLFRDSGQPEKGILRGRALTAICFVPDANKFFTDLKIWTDEIGYVAGISAHWYGNIMGEPVGLYGEESSGRLNWRTSNAFDDLTGFNVYSIQLGTVQFEQEDEREIGFSYTKFGTITITRFVANWRGNKEFYDDCKRSKIDNRVYEYFVTAHSW
jgi:hypothetical protein